MFDVSFTELMVIGVVALIVIGPERLPRVAKTVGHLLGRAQRYVSDVKGDIRREIELDDLRKFKSEMDEAAQSVQTSLRDTETSLRSHSDQLRNVLDQTAQDAQAGLSGTSPATTKDAIPGAAVAPAVAASATTGAILGTATTSPQSEDVAAAAVPAPSPTASTVTPASIAAAPSAPLASPITRDQAIDVVEREAPLSLASAAFGSGTTQTTTDTPAATPAPVHKPVDDPAATAPTTRNTP